jgi:hemin uptake protein HemP
MRQEAKQPVSDPVQVARPVLPARWREITSAELFAGGGEVRIRHLDDIYTLRRTSKGKLILTK